jgi:hypothetical protein
MPRLRELLSSAFSFCRRHGRAVLIIVLLVYVPIDLVLAALPFDDERFFHSLGRQFRVQRLLEMFLGVFCTMAIAHLVLADREGRSLSVQDSLWLAASRWKASVGTQILVNLFFGAGVLALVIPVLFVWVATLFTLPLVALREVSGMAAIKASWALVRGRAWAVFRVLLLLTGIEIAAAIVVVIPFLFLPDHYLLEVVSSLIFDVIGAYFIVVGVQWMLKLESEVAARAVMGQAAVLYPAV